MTDSDISQATIYGYPRQIRDRELKKAVEAYWSTKSTLGQLISAAHELRLARLEDLRRSGLGEIPSNDFSYYDHMLDMTSMLGAIPERHRDTFPSVTSDQERFDRYFAMARGNATLAPLEMTKWFDTNYHYLVPEISPDEKFVLDASKPLGEFLEAEQIGIITRPVIVGPLSFLMLSKPAASTPAGFSPLSLLEWLVPCYSQLLGLLHEAGAPWVQLDEPALVLDQPDSVLDLLERTYQVLGNVTNRPQIVVASYFDELGAALPVLARLPIEGIAIDCTGPGEANVAALEALGGVRDKRLIAGVVSGRNIWTSDLCRAMSTLERLIPLAKRLDVATSCSLLHVPLDVDQESGIDPAVRPWLAFARQKLVEITCLVRGLREGRPAIQDELEANSAVIAARASSPLVHDKAVQGRATSVVPSDLVRKSNYAERHELQKARLELPVIPTTTIGSFPQTPELRKARADLVAGRISAEQYDTRMRAEIRAVIEDQERIGLDVLVHGEPERNDMVQYFAEQLDGFLATSHGWVQSYGSRYVRPPIILGDVARPNPMTLSWARYAQSLTTRPVKGMLTGPVTMLAWSFVRDDQPEAMTARQVALALRDEVLDLEGAGIVIIQVDEPALRETLPLRRSGRSSYLAWAVEAFCLATAGVRDDTQIHTHMCYADFGDILNAIMAMDVDVISLEAARSEMAIVQDLARASYPNEIGAGVWDIHSPRVPSVDEIAGYLRTMLQSFPAERLWSNPDCGLKTRGYREVDESLLNLVEATKEVRAEL